ncbi:DUF2213 domain-containing protein [Nitrobacter vulgaris]|nr:DUF2213 domain-containing protein [Nitrobacter vulgaris]
MRVQCDEALVFDDNANVRYTNDGYLVATPRVARTGIQQYYGHEIGLQGADAKRVINVYRPESEVFRDEALRSLAHKPVTRNHPSGPVDARNWKDVAVGCVGSDILRDGEFIRIPMTLMDARAIDAFKKGTRQLSLGYTCDIDMVPGVTPDGVKYEAVQKNINVNHLAQVDRARGGPKLTIGDSADDAYDRRNQRLTNGWRESASDVVNDAAPVVLRPPQQPSAVTSADVDRAVDRRKARLENAWKS